MIASRIEYWLKSCARNALDDNQLEGDPEKPCKLRASQSARFPSWNQGIARKREFDDPIPLPDGASLSGCATRVNSLSFPRLRALALFGRRPVGRAKPLLSPASKNQHNRRHRACGELLRNNHTRMKSTG